MSVLNKFRMVGRAVECGGLENRCGGNSTGGSNPSPSASKIRHPVVIPQDVLFRPVSGGFYPRYYQCISLRVSNPPKYTATIYTALFSIVNIGNLCYNNQHDFKGENHGHQSMR